MDKKGKLVVSIIIFVLIVLVLSFAIAGRSGTRSGAKACNDRIDNDGDGYTDWPNDPGCSSKQDNNELGTVACDDGVDNDGDGRVDIANDPGCVSATDTSEYGTVACDDGVDNDGDGQIDSNDSGCSSLTDNDETNCGDSVISGGEICDGANLGGETCSSQGFDGGALSCNTQCDGFVTANCWNNYCSDTDGGAIVHTAGTVSGSFGGSSYNNSDYCVDSLTVKEYYCSGDNAVNFNFDCSTNSSGLACSNGACA